MKIRQSDNGWLYYVEDEEDKIVFICWEYYQAFDYLATKHYAGKDR